MQTQRYIRRQMETHHLINDTRVLILIYIYIYITKPKYTFSGPPNL